jgi:hypothetical protein
MAVDEVKPSADELEVFNALESEEREFTKV